MKLFLRFVHFTMWYYIVPKNHQDAILYLLHNFIKKGIINLFSRIEKHS